MYLKRIEIFGFKSFPEKTSIEFLPGVTCIVGPNGCGKSNISDAVRWVLGERSAKMLRGQKMEDVIFSGTSFRQPLNMAEVSLIIDNRDKVLSIGYDEVVLTRRLYRSGDSEYLINKTVCRYKDIQDLILDTGIGSHSYSMIEQGRIDYILQAEPEERRFLIEEAAGISRFKAQKDESIRKLVRTEENLLRLNDIVVEVERNIKYAERQAKRAEKYKEVFEQLKIKEIQKAHAERTRHRERSRSIREKLTQLRTQEKELAGSIESLKQALGLLERKEEERLQELRFKENKRFELKSDIQTREGSKSFNHEKQGEIKNQNETLERDIIEIESGEQEAENRWNSTQAELEEFKQKHTSFHDSFEALVKKANHYDQVLEGLITKEKELQQATFELAGQVAGGRNENHRLELQRTGAEVSLRKLKESEAGDHEELSAVRLKRSEINRNLTQKEAQLELHKGEVRDCESHKQNLTQSQAQLEDKRDTFISQVHDIEAQMRLITELATAMDEKQGLSQEVREKLAGDVRFKLLTQDLRIKSGFEKSVNVFLREWESAVLCQSSTELNSLLSLVEEKLHNRLPLLVSDKIAIQNNLPQVIQWNNHVIIPLTDVIEASPEIMRSFTYLFPTHYCTAGKLSWDEWEAIQEKYPQIQIVETSGRTWGPGALLTVEGTFRKEGESKTLGSEKSEFDELQKQKTQAESVLMECQRELIQVRTKGEDIQRLWDTKNERVLALQFELDIDRRDIKELDENLHKMESEMETAQVEMRSLEEDIQSLDQTLHNQRESLHALETQGTSSEKRLQALHQELQSTRGEAENAFSERNKQEAEHKTYQDRVSLLENVIEDIKQKMNDAEERKAKFKAKLEENHSKWKDLTENNQNLEGELEQLREKLTTEEIALREMEEDRIRLQSERKTKSDSFTDQERLLEGARTECHQLEMESQETDHLMNRIEERIQEAYQVKMEEVESEQPAPMNIELSQLDEEISELKQKITSAGTVNLLAVEEYNELKQRFDYLSGQQNDLEKAREELHEAIRKINRTTRRLFEETYNQVKTNFQEFFKILFEGGTAELVLLDEGNPLDSGIEIMVRPPGKKTQNIALLSGGEKALTAIALLFSLFKIKPSPFSVLDEVDAPLDEANIDRFLEVLKSFLDRSQFIIVTHNRKTIAMGQSLYGVTMQEAGVSKVVSVKLQKEQEGAADSIKEQQLSSSATIE